MVRQLRNSSDFQEALGFYYDGQVVRILQLLFFSLPTFRHLVIYTFGTILLCCCLREMAIITFSTRQERRQDNLPQEWLCLLRILSGKDAAGLISPAANGARGRMHTCSAEAGLVTCD